MHEHKLHRRPSCFLPPSPKLSSKTGSLKSESRTLNSKSRTLNLKYGTMTSQGEAASRAEADRLKLELQELKEKQGIKDTYVGSYLLERLVQLGVKVRAYSILEAR